MEKVKTALQNAAATVVGDAKDNQLRHFTVDDAQKNNFITTNYGVKQSDTNNSLKAGERGPILMEDIHFREKMTHFDHERIPERVVHARGAAAHGYFQVYEPLTDLTRADFLQHPNKKTPVFVRFSTVLGSRGSPDTVRDVRGFATKFYTDEGNFDLVGNNMPVFFIQDAIKFPDLIHAGKPQPHVEIPQAQSAHDNFWDFVSLTPETTHMIMWALSDRAIPRSYRLMQGFGIHTFVLANAEGKRRFVKFHWIPKLGTHSLVWDEAVKLNGVDPDFHRRDLYEAIDSGAYPEWELGLQIIEEKDEHKFDFDILDSTKLIPEEQVPIKIIGKMVLNRNPSNFFAETEQVAFCTSHFVPGIETSNDPLLQGRHHSYVDTQISRLGGPNFEEIPINRPVCPFTNNQRDGMHRQTINSAKVNYFPNRFGCPAQASFVDGGYTHSPFPLDGPKIRARGPKFSEHFEQARLFFHSLSSWERDHIINAAIFELSHVDDKQVREKVVERFNLINFELATTVAKAIGVKVPEKFAGTPPKTTSPALSQENTAKNSITARQIAVLVAPGYDKTQAKALKAAIDGFGAVTKFISTNKGPIEDGDSIEAFLSYWTTKSVQYDAVILIGGKHYQRLEQIGEVQCFLNETFKHGKPIIAIQEGVDFLETFKFPKIKLATPSQPYENTQGVLSTRAFDANSLKIGETVNFGKEMFNTIAAHRYPLRDIGKIPS